MTQRVLPDGIRRVGIGRAASGADAERELPATLDAGLNERLKPAHAILRGTMIWRSSPEETIFRIP
jgi:hypothetical protein